MKPTKNTSSKQKISDDYLRQQVELHKNPNYGVASKVFAPLVAMIISANEITELTDYGAGKKNLLTALNDSGINLSAYYPYDPAFPEHGPPIASSLVCCIDVLEHIEPCYLDAVLDELQSITTSLGFITIHMGPAGKRLPDGRNAHLIQAPSSWWLERIARYFEVEHLESHQLMGNGIWMLVTPKKEITFISE